MKLTHKEVVDAASKYCRKIGCSVILNEFVAGCSEEPDVLSFKTGFSIVIECKVSRNDFFNDFKKYHRRGKESKAMGNYRFYCCPKNMIKKEEIPDGWGLLYVDDKQKVEVIIGPKSNVFGYDDGTKFFEANYRNEKIILISSLRKMNEKKTNNMNYDVFTKEYDEFENLLIEQENFSKKTFGKDYPLDALFKHLKKELDEVLENPNDLEEWSDCFLIFLDSMWRNKISTEVILNEAKKKLIKNQKRKWNKPDKDGIIHHKKDSKKEENK